MSGDELLDAALAHHALGRPVIPVHQDKRPACPAWGQWRFRAQTEAEVLELFSGPAHGLAVLTWPASELVILDFDGPHAADAWERTGIPLPPTARQRTRSGGTHLGYLVPPDSPRPGQEATEKELKRKVRLVTAAGCGCEKECGVDLLFNGYFVTAPTPGYQEDPDAPFEPGSLAVIPQAVLDLARAADRDNGSARGRTDLPGEPIPHGRRNAALTSLGGTMRRRGMGEPAILAALLEENAARCQPQLPEAEVRGIASSIGRYAPSAGDGRPAEPGTERPGKIRVLSLEELMATNFPPRRAHVGRGILPAQGKALLTGHGGVGKTVLLLQTALELAAGRAWLGRWLGDGPSRVGLLLQEDPQEITQARFRGLLRALGLEERTSLPVFLNDPSRYLSVTSDADLAWIVAFVKDRALDLLIPDPLITLHRENENDNARMRYVLDRFTAVQAETGCAVLLAHHHRKSPEGTEDFDAARGARAIQDWARTVVSLTARGKVDGRDRIRMTFTKLNYGPMPPGAITLERDPETLLVRVVEEVEICSPERAAQSLEEMGGSAERKADWYAAIEKATGCSDRTARQAGTEAVKRGLVVEGGRTRAGQPVRVADRVSFGKSGNEALPLT
jgi:hypothetical protein